jgi:Asp-tRNA(Asn)/Glu-tRNA(Gln) amidotransferase A subunit family amidase
MRLDCLPRIAMLATIHPASDSLRRGQTTPLHLLETCLERIDRCEARVRAWVFVDREAARAQAEERTAELRRGRWRGPLHGIPIGIKDIFDVFDWPTAAGSRLWQHSIARQDATVVERLRRAGAVFVGKTVTTQYASFDPPPTRNPWDASRTPGGSSSGSAAALACGTCLGALGSQTGGSITRPASYCGLAGCKPTFGRVSTHGVVPLAPSMDHPGPLARCVRDLAVLLQAIAGPDPLAPVADAPGSPIRPVPDWTAALRGPQRPPRLGRLRGLFESRAESVMQRCVDQASERLRTRGAEVVEVALPAGFAEVVERHRVVMAVEGAAFHGERLRRHPDDYGPCITALLEEGLACPAPEYARCKAHQEQLRHDLLSCLEGVDVLLTPATTGPAPDAGTTGDPAFNAPWSYVGYPTVSFPVGKSPEGLPLCLQLAGRPWDEGTLFAAAAWCEDVLETDLGEPPLGD